MSGSLVVRVAWLMVAALTVTLGATAASGHSDSAAFERAKALALGIDSTCALTVKGGVKCWGYDGHDELGHGQGPSDRWRPFGDVIGLHTGVTAITAGVRHHCALTSAAGVKCWGANYAGALGDGTEDRHAEGPVEVSGVSGVSAISAGHDFSCVLVGGGVKCWGDNSRGMLGDGTRENRFAPVDVVGLTSGVTAIDSGGIQSCALMSDGGVRCWGGQFGSSSVRISGLDGGAKAITSGCALTNAGGVKCWDGNATAVDVTGLSSGIKAVSGEGLNHCALTGTGGVKCWGDNEFGQLGDGTMLPHETPIDVPGLRRGITALTTGSFHSCAITEAGGIKCWGGGGTGQLGNGSTRLFSRPVSVLDFGARARLSILSGPVKVTSGGTAPTRVRCGADAGCQGTLTLVGFGRRVFTIAPGRTKAVAVPLAARGLRRLVRVKRLQAQARAAYKQPDGSSTTHTRTVVLVAPRR
jgi:alpha-tubulin suppressor-like RCC1 family protein